MKHLTQFRFVILGSLILVAVILNGCGDGNNSDQGADVNAFTTNATNYGNTVELMNLAFKDHYDGMMSGDMSGMMSTMETMMDDYHDTMMAMLHSLRDDAIAMEAYCNSLGMHDDQFWADMHDTNIACLQEMDEHYQEMMGMMTGSGGMGQMSQDMRDEMNEHHDDMMQYLATMIGYHEWMMDHDSNDH